MEEIKLQTLYDAAHLIFSGKDLPNFRQIQCLKNLSSRIEAIDVGIDEFGSKKEAEGLFCGRDVSEITYIHIHECEELSIGVFCFPAGAVFPLHDHPGMTVISKLLYGSISVKAYDWVKVDSSPRKTVGLGGKVMDGVMEAPCEPSMLFPRGGGNIHSFTALTPCAILDVLSPPYSEDFGRHSTYFAEFPIPSLPGYAILEERDLPDDLVVNGAPYLGPQIVTEYDRCVFL